MQQIYNFKKADFDNNGFDKNGKLFADIIGDWESEFHQEFSPFFANHFYANHSTMKLLQNCFVSDDNEDFGRDGEYDLETNLKIEDFSKRQTTYALGSGIKENEDEPMFLIIDDKISDGMAILKYIPDNDDGEDENPIESIDTEMKIKVLK